jgi:epoxide hydrolase-like predicted phosphatase
MQHRAVIFDLGGVILGSPLHAIADFEIEHGIPSGRINRVVVDSGRGGAWSRLERGELPMREFYPAFENDCESAGVTLSAEALMERVGAAARPRPTMIRAVARIRAGGFGTAALTNNWIGEDDGAAFLKPHFDVFIESSVIGLRKPDPRIYHHTCDAIGIGPEEAIFLDDIGSNLKAARALGMTTIKVDDPDEALQALGELVGIELREDA